MIYATPSSSETFYLDGAPTGLTGTLQFRIVPVGSTTPVVGPSSSGITEVSSGRYQAVATTPATVGDFLPQWVNGPTVVDDEVLRVTFDAPFVSGTGDLTTLASVRAFMQKPDNDTDQDDLISTLISSASKVIVQWAGRQFAPAETNATHSFIWDGGDRVYFTPHDLRTATLAQLDTDLGSPVTLTATTDYGLEPLNAADGVYQGFTINKTVRNTPGARRLLTVTGDWGFASVPADVQHACNVTVKWWIQNDVSAFSSGFDANTDQFTRGEALPQGVQRLLSAYRRTPV